MIDNQTLQLAHIIAGEAGGCGFVAMLAVAHIWTRNKRWSGHGEVTPSALWAAMVYRFIADPTSGANFLFSQNDLLLRPVRDIIRTDGRASPIVYQCKRGALYAY